MDYLLRTQTESDMDDALVAAGLAQEVADADGEVSLVFVDGVTIDHIGPIPAQVDPEDPMVIVRPGDNRWHTNIRVSFELPKAQEDLLPTFAPLPSVPYRVFI